MKILVSNDDGIGAPGLDALIRALCSKHTVYVVAPSGPQSAVSRSVTLFRPLHAERRTLPAFPDVWAYAVDGTPVDCVRLALGNLLPEPVDLCITGINFGYNVGTDTLYSGTAAAAIEAATDGVIAVAMSCGIEQRGAYWETSADVALKMADFAVRHPLPRGAFYNVNVPDIAPKQLHGVRPAKLSPVPYDLRYTETLGEDGRTEYTTPWVRPSEQSDDTDCSLVYAGYAAVSVLTYDNEHNELIDAVPAKEWALLGGGRCG